VGTAILEFFDTRKVTVPLSPAALFEFDFFEPLPIQIEVPLPLRRLSFCDGRSDTPKQLGATR
jgi:hypothetical protein